MAAHLAGAFAANTTLPVVGIPMKGGAMDGLDVLLATVQMPSGFRGYQAERREERRVSGCGDSGWVADDELAAKLDSFRADTAAAIAKKTPPLPLKPQHCKEPSQGGEAKDRYTYIPYTHKRSVA